MPEPRRWVGMVLAMLGLALLTLPAGPVSIAAVPLSLIVCAAIGSGIYFFHGRRVTDPSFRKVCFIPNGCEVSIINSATSLLTWCKA